MSVAYMYDVHLSEITGLLSSNWKRLVAAGLGGALLVALLTMFLVPREWQARATLVLGNQTGSASGLLASALAGVGGGSLAPLVPQPGLSTDLFQTILQSWDTRTHIVRDNDLQQVFGDDHWQKSVERMAANTQVRTDGPASMALAVTLRGTPRGLVTTAEADQDVRELTVACVNSYLKTLGQTLEEIRISSAKSQRIFLEAEKPKAEADYHRAQAAVTHWEAAHHILAPPKAAEAITQKLFDIQSDLTTAQVERATTLQAAARARALLQDQPEMVAAASSQTANPEITRVTQALALLEQQLAEQQVFYHKTPQHPDVQRLVIQKQELLAQLQAAQQRAMIPAGLSQARSSVHDQTLGQLLQAEVTASAGGAKVAGLQRALAEARTQVESLTWASLEYAKLYEQAQITESIYETIVKQYEAAVLNEKAEEPVFFVIDPAVVPWKKASPSLGLNATLGLLLGLLAAVVWTVKTRPRDTGGKN
jgi:hypothetical protein